MADTNSSVPRPGDKDYYAWVTHTGKYAPKKKVNNKKAAAESQKVEQTKPKKGLLEQQLDYYKERNDRLKKFGINVN